MKKLKRFLLALVKIAGSLIIIILLYNFFSYSSLPAESLPQSEGITNQAYATQIKEARAQLAQIPGKLNTPSFSVAVGIKGQIVWSEAIGHQDIKAGIAATPQTQYRIGSSSKAVTSTLAARLYQKGLLDLDQNINRLISGYPEKQWGFTPTQLLSHTAGLPDYADLKPGGIYRTLCNCKEYSTVSEGLSVFSEVPLLFEPGTQYKYNSFDIVLMSAYMEQLAQKDFLTLLDEEVFKPAGMKSTFGDHSQEAPETMATFYETSDEDYRKWRTFGFLPTDINLSYKWAGGGLVSTPSDLVRMGNTILTDSTFLNKKTLSTFWEPQKLENGEVNPQRYALGWRSYREFEHTGFEKPTWIVHHGGVSKGAMNFLLLFPEHDLVIDAAINTKAPEFDLLWTEVMDLAAIFLKTE